MTQNIDMNVIVAERRELKAKNIEIAKILVEQARLYEAFSQAIKNTRFVIHMTEESYRLSSAHPSDRFPGHQLKTPTEIAALHDEHRKNTDRISRIEELIG